MKNKKIIIVIIGILIVMLLMVGLYFYGLTSTSKKSEKVEFTTGSGTREVVDNLYDAKLIKSKVAAIIYIKTHPKLVIQKGTYELDRSYDTKKIIKILATGNTNNTISITFIEGQNIPDYINKINKEMKIDKKDIEKTLNDQDYLKSLIKKYEFLTEDILNSDIYYPLEGYLFPETYEFYKDCSVKDIIEKMLNKTEDVLDKYSELTKKSDLSIHEILTIASIIEKEAHFDEDRALVSQVIHKRLDIGMILQMDSTSAYGNLIIDKASNNAYNTYSASVKRLPVGPISSVSEKSLVAALKPSDTDYSYFCSNKNSYKTYFSNTLGEHNMKVSSKEYCDLKSGE